MCEGAAWKNNKMSSRGGLVDYSSSSEEEEEQVKTELPPLPESFHDAYQTGPRLEDEEFHGGRVRAVQHVSGLWPTFVYLEWMPNEEELDILKTVTKGLGDNVGSLAETTLGVRRPLHISLSDTIMLKWEDRDRFVDRVSEILETSLCGGPVDCRLAGDIRLFMNQTQTLVFYGALIRDDRDRVRQMAYNVYHLLTSEFDNMGAIMDIATPHVSIASAPVADPPNNDKHPRYDQLLGCIQLRIPHLKIKIGRQVHVLKFSSTNN